jgi:hypothetical protein
VPDEDVADAYPNSRIVYLKLTCSITGWNPSESLQNAQTLAQQAGTWDDMQNTLWQVIVASGWAQKYWQCLGAIMQIGVYPNSPDGVSPEDYPYFLDFEPKKRELYETVTAGSEALSGSADSSSITKGTTNVNSTELGASVGFSYAGIGASGSVTNTSTDTTVNQKTTDTSREARETLSRTTSFSQMYQLFNGYHLGTNRAVFLVAPRPHTVSGSSQTEFNLIDGERKLEGIQEVFLVVLMPKSLDGFCMQASLDTGHQAAVSVPLHLVGMRPANDGGPNTDGTPAPPPPPPPPATPVKQLVITRRIAQSCGTFDANGNFVTRKLNEPIHEIIVGELGLTDLPTTVMLRIATGTVDKSARIAAANNLNTLQSQITRMMLDNASSVRYTPKSFVQTGVFQSLVANEASKVTIPLSQLAGKGYLTTQDAALLARNKIVTLGDLFKTEINAPEISDPNAIRLGIINRLLNPAPPKPAPSPSKS